MRWAVLGVLLVVLVVYLILGGVIFHFLESDNEEQTTIDTKNFTENFLREHPCMTEQDLEDLVRVVLSAYDNGVVADNSSSSGPNWDVISSIFFASTIVTTIGYGHISPATVGGRIFFTFFAILGIPLCLVALAGFGQKMMIQAKKLDKKLTFCETRPKLYKVLRSLVMFCLGLLLFILIPAIIFSAIEEWSYGTSVYYGVVTLSTVGFGDYVAGLEAMDDGTRAVYRICVSLWIFIGLSWLAIVLSSIQESIQEVVDKAEHKHNKKSAEEDLEMAEQTSNGQAAGKKDQTPKSSTATLNAKEDEQS